jgi:hypothetical protein
LNHKRIDLAKVKKALDLVSDYKNGFEVVCKGWGEELEGHSTRWTVFDRILLTCEEYKGLPIYSVMIGYDYQSAKAYSDLKSAVQAVYKLTAKYVEATELPYEYTVDEIEEVTA